MATDEEITETAQSIGHLLASAMPPGVGFILITFGFDSNWVSYLSNGDRESVSKALREMAERLESGL